MPTTINVDVELKRQLSAKAQWLGLKSADELAVIGLRAVLEMIDEEGWVTFPLMLTQVETVSNNW